MIAIIHGKLLTVTQGVIEDGTLLIDQGKITAVGQNIAVPEGAEILDASGKWVTPGLIDAHSHLSGLNEPAWMPSTMDANEITDPVTAQVRMLDAFNPLTKRSRRSETPALRPAAHCRAAPTSSAAPA